MLTSAMALAPSAQPVAFKLSAKAVEGAFTEMEQRLMADPNIAYDPVFGIHYSSAKCTLTEPNIAKCSFRKTYRNGKSVKTNNTFRRIDQNRWIADLEL
jgi:hypothetical protein